MTSLSPEREKTQPSRIALYVSSLHGGGAERVMLEIAGGLARHDIPVDLVLDRAEGPYLEFIPEGVRLIDLDSNHTYMSFLKLLRYLHRERPDALLSTLGTPNVAALLAKKLFFRNLRVVVRQASTFSMDLAHGSFRDRIVMRLLKRLLPTAGAVVGVSSGVADDLRQNVPRMSGLVHAIPNPVAVADISKNAALPVNHPWFADSEVPVILTAGRLVPQKDYPTLLRAFSEVVKSCPARLVVIGEGPERSGLAELARDLDIAHIVDFHGFQSNPFAYMSNARLFVLSSIFEGFPNVLVQSMACGTPVVSTDCPSGPREILQDGKWGALVPVGDWQALAATILSTLDSPIPPASLISRAGDYSSERIIGRYLEVLVAK